MPARIIHRSARHRRLPDQSGCFAADEADAQRIGELGQFLLGNLVKRETKLTIARSITWFPKEAPREMTILRCSVKTWTTLRSLRSLSYSIAAAPRNGAAESG